MKKRLLSLCTLTAACAALGAAAAFAAHAGSINSPGTPQIVRVDPDDIAPPDPFAIAELSRDVRPPDYAVDFARLAMEFSGVPNPLAVCAKARPDWLAAAAQEVGAPATTLPEALKMYSR